MGFEIEAFTKRLSDAVEAYDEEATATLCDELGARLAATDNPLPATAAARVLTLLREPRFFRLLAEVADTLIRSGQDSPVVMFRYAQALIDQGLLVAAEAVLCTVRPRTEKDPALLSELEGMVGRTFKQMYVLAGPTTERRAAFVQQALDAYERGQQAQPASHRWHAINSVALRSRAIQDHVALSDTVDPEPAANRVLADIEREFADPEIGLTPWDCAVAAEACLALGRCDEAVRWLERYIGDPRVDSFELAGTLRQLTEIWQLDPATPPGNRMLPLLRAQILSCEQGASIELVDSEMRDLPSAPDAGLEKILGSDGVVTYRWYRTGLIRSRGVAHISDLSDRPVGTGFLVEGCDLHDTFNGVPVLVTNAHVIGGEVLPAGALAPEEAVVTFQVATAGDSNEPREYRVDRVIWTSAPDVLDTSVVQLEGPVPAGDVCPVTDRLPRLDGKQRVFVIGHPQGRSIAFSIADNVFLDHDDRVIHYRAPTEPGSSGSPVFNRNWEVIGLHHSGRTDMPRLHGTGSYPANEGIWIGAIRAALASELPA
jgi:hypothetical protein